jgi:hypothetical protein
MLTIGTAGLAAKTANKTTNMFAIPMQESLATGSAGVV